MTNLRQAANAAHVEREQERQEKRRADEAVRKQHEAEQWAARVRMMWSKIGNPPILSWEGMPEHPEVVAIFEDGTYTAASYDQIVIHEGGVYLRIQRHRPSGRYVYQIVTPCEHKSDATKANKYRLVRQITCLADIGEYLADQERESSPMIGNTD